MKWLMRALQSELHGELRDLRMQITELKMQQAELLKMLLAINQSIAKLVLQHAQQPEELTNEQRAALLGLPPSMSQLVDWEQLNRRR